MEVSRALQPRLAALREGLGSAYERYALNARLEKLIARHAIRTIAEWPANGVLGVPGLKSLAAQRLGCAVTLLHPSAPFLDDVATLWRAAGEAEPARLIAAPEDEEACAPRSFDLVWSFCALEHCDDPARTIRAMLRASRGLVLVYVQNAWAPGVHLHRLEHALSARPWDHGRIGEMRAERVAEHVRAAGGRVVEIGGCDLPPWPDLNVRLPRPWQREDGKLVPRPRRYGPGDPVMTREAVVEVFGSRPKLDATMRALMRWHDAVETRLSSTMLRVLAHHPFVLARPS
jgi:SAM-dependent methyltransferase